MSDLPDGLDAQAIDAATAWKIVEVACAGTRDGLPARNRFVSLVNAYIEARRAIAKLEKIEEKKP